MNFSDIPILKIGNDIVLAGAVFQGEGNVYLFPFPGSDLEELRNCHWKAVVGSVETVPMTPDDWKALLRQSDLCEVEVTDGNAKAVMRKCERIVDSQTSWDCFVRDGFACAYCGAKDKFLTVDHLIPWEQCGPTIPANLLSACKPCNRKRGNTPYDEWIHGDAYYRLAKNLSLARREENERLAGTLSKIQKVSRIRSR